MSARARAAVAFAILCLGFAPAAFAQPQPYQTGDLFISTTGGAVYGYRFDPALGTWVASLALLTETPDSPNTGSAFDRSGNFYVATFVAGTLSNPVNGKVVKFSRDWDPESGSVSFETYGFAPKSIVFDAAGNMFVGHARKNAPPVPCAPPPPGVTLRGDVLTKVAPNGACLGAFTVEVEGLAQAGDGGTAKEGVDWIDLASDQRTIFYTSQGRRIMRYDTAAQTQLPDFALLPDDPSCFQPNPPVCGQAFALRLLPGGGLLVADRLNVKRFDAAGNLVMVYDQPAQDEWFSLNLDPDGTSFWSGDSFNAHLFKFDIASGALLVAFDTDLGVRRLFGVSVFNEPTQGVKEIGDVKGLAYVDTNHNGLHDAGEPGIGGVTITLTGGTTTTTTTAADGTYAFIGVAAGHYSVSSPASASGWQLFTPSPLELDLAAGDTKADRNFGYVSGSISGVAYVDANRNGIRDLGEPGLEHVLITLGGDASAVGYTSADGSYTFHMIASGHYTSSAPSTAGGKGLATLPSLDVVVGLGEDKTDVNFGYVPGGLSGFVYVDANRNGVRDGGETGISGVTLTLAGGPGGTATTDANGVYSFADLDEGPFSVTAPPTASGKVLGTSSPLTTAVIAGQTTQNVNFGYVTGGISGFVYVDANRNGVRDGSEVGISGVALTLTGGPGGTTTSDSNGAYTFTSLDAGSFSVGAPDTANGKARATAASLAATVIAGQTTADVNFAYVTGGISGIVYVDVNRNGVRDSGETGLSGVTLTLTGGPGGTTTSDSSGAYTFTNLDAGPFSVAAPDTANGKARATTASLAATVIAGQTTADVNFAYVTGGISGFVYVDTNRNGVRDGGEVGISGVTLTLTGGPGGTTTSDSNGAYTFTTLDAGSFSVGAPDTADGKARATTASLTATVIAGQTTANVNFGYVTGGISGVVYVDTNRNGVRDAGEAGISGVVLTLTGGPGGTATTDANGAYSFSSLLADSYSVLAPPAAGALALETASPLAVALAAGQLTANVNFGYVPVLGGLSGVVYLDSNGNGVRDAGEPGIGGVVVTLATGATTTSAADGTYSFSDLTGGAYIVGAPATAAGNDLGTTSPLPATVTGGQTTPNLNFGYVASEPPGHHPGDKDCKNPKHHHPRNDDCPETDHHPGDKDCRDPRHHHPKGDDCPPVKTRHHPGDKDCRNPSHHHPKDDDCPRPKTQHHPGDGDCKDRSHHHPKDDDCPPTQHHPGDKDCKDRSHHHTAGDDCPPATVHHDGDRSCKDPQHHHTANDDCRTSAKTGGQRSTTK